MSAFHPDLAIGRFIPKYAMGPRLTKLMRGKPRLAPVPDDITVEDVTIAATETSPEVSMRVYTPATRTTPSPALFWIHGGGFITGSPEQDERTNIAFARELGIVVAAVRYRLAPEHQAADAMQDVYTGLRWLFGQADARGIDAGRIAIGGASAGGGLAAALVLYALDKGEVSPAFQLLVYPMLDDRTVTRADLDTKNVRVWTPGSNRFGWTSYLGQEPGSPDVSAYAAPARREDLTGLPPAWIGVGTLDLFHDEDVTYHERLLAAGVPSELVIVDGAFHGFDAVLGGKNVSRSFRQEQARALRAGLFG